MLTPDGLGEGWRDVNTAQLVAVGEVLPLVDGVGHHQQLQSIRLLDPLQSITRQDPVCDNSNNFLCSIFLQNVRGFTCKCKVDQSDRRKNVRYLIQ